MEAGFHIDPADARPIWRQIEENVRHLVASGALQPSTAVPSVRDLARILAVNPATVAKAYQRLTDSGVLAVRRGDGTYVSAAPPALSTDQRERRLLAEATRYASLAATLGATAGESIAVLEAAWASLGVTPPSLDGEPATMSSGAAGAGAAGGRDSAHHVSPEGDQA